MRLKLGQFLGGIICFSAGMLLSNIISLHQTNNMSLTLEEARDVASKFHDAFYLYMNTPVSGVVDELLERNIYDDVIENKSMSDSVTSTTAENVFIQDSTVIREEREDQAAANNINDMHTVVQQELRVRSLFNSWTEEREEVSPQRETKFRNKMAPRESCNCHRTLKHPLDDKMDERRRKEALVWLQHEAERREPFSFCRAMSPLDYIGSGIVVEPLQSVQLVGISVDPLAADVITISNKTQRLTLNIKSTKGLGKLHLRGLAKFKRLVKHGGLEIFGNDTSQLTLLSRNVSKLNRLLNHVLYKSTYYDVNIRDILEITFMSFKVNVNIHIRRQILPDLYDSGPDGLISDKVTVITKTFERYDAVNRLVESINKFYPNMMIIVADDTENAQRIMGRNVKQTLMPFAEGLFAGRGVALSQVTTKYFVWVDDDFVFTEKTKLELMLKKLDDPLGRLDVIGGTVNGRAYNKCFIFKYGGATGDCLKTIYGSYRPHERFQECDVADVVIDFFMARTSVVRQVGFDPEYRRIGHSEFFIDGLGKMRVAACKDVDIAHFQMTNTKYALYRTRKDDTTYPKRHTNHLFFSNNLKCT